MTVHICTHLYKVYYSESYSFLLDTTTTPTIGVPLAFVLQGDVPTGVASFNATVTWVWAVLMPGCHVFVIRVHYLFRVVRFGDVGEVFVVAPGVVNFAFTVLVEGVSFAAFPVPVVIFTVAVGHSVAPLLSCLGMACLLV